MSSASLQPVQQQQQQQQLLPQQEHKSAFALFGDNGLAEQLNRLLTAKQRVQLITQTVFPPHFQLLIADVEMLAHEAHSDEQREEILAHILPHTLQVNLGSGAVDVVSCVETQESRLRVLNMVLPRIRLEPSKNTHHLLRLFTTSTGFQTAFETLLGNDLMDVSLHSMQKICEIAPTDTDRLYVLQFYPRELNLWEKEQLAASFSSARAKRYLMRYL